MKRITGAQEKALTRLERKHKLDTITTSTADPAVHVSWQEKGRDGEPRRVVAHVTPEGRVVERP